jgi:hypothetical protein
VEPLEVLLSRRIYFTRKSLRILNIFEEILDMILCLYLFCTESNRNACKVLIGTPERRLLGRTSRMWEYNIKMDLKGTAYESVDWIYLILYRDQ